MTLSETLIAVVRLAVSSPALDVRILDRTSRWVSDVANVSIRSLGYRRIGTDEPRVTDDGDPSGDLLETIHGVRVLRLQIIVDGDVHDLGEASEDLADRIVAGLERSDVAELLEEANLSRATCGAVVTAPARGDSADVRSVSVFEVAFNTSREVAGGRVAWIETAPVTLARQADLFLAAEAGAIVVAGLAPALDPPALYYAHGWTDSDYYQNAAGEGRGILGTVRLVGYLASLPAAVQKVLAGRTDASNNGWRLQTGISVEGISLIAGGSGTGWAESPRYTFAAGDVGRLFVLHGWVDAGGVHLAIGGAEVGAGSGSLITTTDPGGAAYLTLGRWQHAGGFSNPHVGIASLCASPTVMTPAEIAADAAAIMLSGTRLLLPTMPGEDLRLVAADALAGPWVDRDGNDCTLAESGAVSVSVVA